MSEDRDITIDIAKGIGIILVVVGHLAGVAGKCPDALVYVKKFLYQFHIPLFFYLSGLFINDIESFKSFFFKKIKRLYVPYVIANLIFLALDVILRVSSGIPIIWINDLKHAVKIILGIALTPMGGATWFLIALLKALIAFKLLLWLFKNRQVFAVLISIAIGVSGLFVTTRFTLGSSMVALMYVSIGYYSKGLILKIEYMATSRRIVVGLLALLALIVFCPHNGVDVSAGRYANPPLAILGSLFGILLSVLFSSLLSENKAVSLMLSKIGSNTMPILLGHLCSFKVIVFLQMVVMSAPFSILLSHPCYDVSEYWSFAYLVIGIALPILFADCSNRIWRELSIKLHLKSKCI